MTKLCIPIGLLLMALASCKTKTIAPKGNYILATVAQGREQITQDTCDHFFEQVNRIDMAIQLGKPVAEVTTEGYKAALKESVQAFTPSETAFVNTCMRTAYEACDKLGITLPKITLIKVSGEHYGDGTYYTRQACIVIPAGELRAGNQEAFTRVMLHEIAHVYSRYHPEKREALYAALGFERINVWDTDPLFKQRLLLNPDGADPGWGIRVQTAAGDDILAMPLIFARSADFVPGNGFFSYLDMGYFAVGQDGHVDPASIQQAKNLKGFKEKTGDNTDYIIHPDEILADNFVQIVLGNAPRHNSEIGKAAHDRIRAILSRSPR